MTFTEAAAQVLRLVGKPLHYKEITDVAIEKNLLSHVGKSPEVTMGASLTGIGVSLFVIGIGLSVYRDRLLMLPERISKREGLFRILDWR